MLSYEQAIEAMRERGWCYEARQPHTGWTRVMVGTRLNTDAYGPFPSGFVSQVVAEGDGLLDAVQNALAKEEAKIDKAISADAFPNK